ncbi:MAG TPA: glutamyl-tRNA reductase [Actinomycetota bacterium]|nr:glutamyl-tRNA reductase [Actinomycetota bacterium]
MPVLALGVSHRRAPVELLERLSFGDDDYAKAYGRLTSLDDVHESVLLSTCNRVEVYAEVTGFHQGFQDLKRFLSEATDVPVEEFAEPLYSHYEDQAAEHLFSVAAGLDSMVVGEPQILSQVRAAFRRADAEGTTGPSLSALFGAAVRTGRRARTETAIGASPSAFVEAGAVLAAEHLGGLEGKTLLVVGAGKMGSLSVQALVQRGMRDITILSRRPERAARQAERVGAAHGGLDDLPAALSRADLVIASTGATGAVITADMIRAAGRSPMFLLDLGMPRDVETEAAGLQGVRVADIDDLREVLLQTQGGDDQAVAAARAIVAQEAQRYAEARRTRLLAPLIEALHARGEAVRAEELRRLGSRLADLSDREREAVETLSRRIVARLLHDPTVRLKDLAGRGLADGPAKTVADLFDLDPERE